MDPLKRACVLQCLVGRQLGNYPQTGLWEAIDEFLAVSSAARRVIRESALDLYIVNGFWVDEERLKLSLVSCDIGNLWRGLGQGERIGTLSFASFEQRC